MNQPQFKNTAVMLTPDQRQDWDGKFDPRRYHFDKAPELLFVVSRFFQRVISIGGTFMLTGKFHTRDCDIYKCEGGCVIDGCGELVLGNRSAYWDSYYRSNGRGKKLEKDRDSDLIKLINLISDVVLNWDPMDPMESMLQAAVDCINEIGVKKVTLKEFKEGVVGASCGGVFGGNALSDFFNWNPFAKPPIDIAFERYCRVDIGGEKGEDVDQEHADRALGYELLDKMIAKGREFYKTGYFSIPMCCSPSRRGKDVQFWINTGRQTQIDGWKSLDEINAYLAGTGELIDTAKY